MEDYGRMFLIKDFLETVGLRNFYGSEIQDMINYEGMFLDEIIERYGIPREYIIRFLQGDD